MVADSEFLDVRIIDLTHDGLGVAELEGRVSNLTATNAEFGAYHTQMAERMDMLMHDLKKWIADKT